MVRVLLEILEGNDPDRDRIEAAKVTGDLATLRRATRLPLRSSVRRGQGSRRYWSERRRQRSARQEPTEPGGWSRAIRPSRRMTGDSKEKSAASSANATATAALNLNYT